MTRPPAALDTPLGACTLDPDRWAVGADEGAKELCRACPRRWLCAREACRTSGAVGVWAGIYIPESGRARQFALRQLQSLAERNGFTVQKAG
ncbi:transcription factor WhiB [Mycolicibacterium sp. GF69]|uniref:WhiB family transcriptional regulator n=1 Tax=Mycolicibacterium sp. GF69 TaxID=2267251 RepID=UPI000DCDFEAD|nr:WhiB family transcriptional regulator [Mycolicibacterium sp. GF69]RAV08407.1 transcription factor WhiB [Mycolicibacterium sp. GF69]